MLELDVFLEGVAGPVGRLVRHDTSALSFQYLQERLPHPISLSLPLRDAPFGDVETRAFFDNLLFENAQRDQIMQRYGLEYSDIVGLLFHLGQDCPGAISVVPAGNGPAKQPGDLLTDYDALEPNDLERLMRSLRDHRRVPLNTKDPSPLAGVQGKVALTLLPDGRLALPRPGLNVPTTHILKVPRATEMRLVEQEHLLMGMAANLLDHPVAETQMLGHGDLLGLLVTRFDRELAGTSVRRLHQEDFAQALGLGASLKYQRNGVGRTAFTAARIGEMLLGCEHPGRARQAFLEGTLGNLLLGNTDNHAKNHALIYRTRANGPSRPDLAPFYDIVPTLIDDQVTHQLSFDIGRAQMTDDISAGDLAAFLSDLGYRRMTPALKARMTKLVVSAVAMIPTMSGPARKRIGDVVSEQARRIAPALGMDLAVPERDLVVINRP